MRPHVRCTFSDGRKTTIPLDDLGFVLSHSSGVVQVRKTLATSLWLRATELLGVTA